MAIDTQLIFNGERIPVSKLRDDIPLKAVCERVLETLIKAGKIRRDPNNAIECEFKTIFRAPGIRPREIPIQTFRYPDDFYRQEYRDLEVYNLNDFYAQVLNREWLFEYFQALNNLIIVVRDITPKPPPPPPSPGRFGYAPSPSPGRFGYAPSPSPGRFGYAPSTSSGITPPAPPSIKTPTYAPIYPAAPSRASSFQPGVSGWIDPAISVCKDRYRLIDLRQLASENGLPISGNKTDLCERLQKYGVLPLY